MELDACVIIPTLFITILAIVLAARFIPKNQPEKKKKIELDHGEDIPSWRASAIPVVDAPNAGPQVEVPVIVAQGVPKISVAPVVEDINVLEEESLREDDIFPNQEVIHMVQDLLESVPEPVNEPEPNTKSNPVKPEPVVEELEVFDSNDVATAEEVHFTPERKFGKLEKLVTKEEMEEQSAAE
ncbi:hypothetical protein DPEC_G00304150 [Dallia pectoralis]|uniref:Uncharacterized protein n=1 Tax=Dallia pectoralis TaxID=75939 RepID=A0ACC2FDQ2_DALPE|nr:hypothetical protein DPEC_G00304150 [Dallia pectoralis]